MNMLLLEVPDEENNCVTSNKVNPISPRDARPVSPDAEKLNDCEINLKLNFTPTRQQAVDTASGNTESLLTTQDDSTTTSTTTEEETINKLIGEVIPIEIIDEEINNQQLNKQSIETMSAVENSLQNIPNKNDTNFDFLIEKMQKTIEDKKDAEIKNLIEKFKESEKAAIELVQKEDENKYNVLNKRHM